MQSINGILTHSALDTVRANEGAGDHPEWPFSGGSILPPATNTAQGTHYSLKSLLMDEKINLLLIHYK